MCELKMNEEEVRARAAEKRIDDRRATMNRKAKRMKVPMKAWDVWEVRVRLRNGSEIPIRVPARFGAQARAFAKDYAEGYGVDSARVLAPVNITKLGGMGPVPVTEVQPRRGRKGKP